MLKFIKVLQLDFAMKYLRIIPRIGIKDDKVIKSVCFEGVRVVGEPAVFIKKYFSQGADEILYMDMVASLYRRNFNFKQLLLVSKGIFVPLTAGGGIRSLTDIKKILRCGADKVAINTAAVAHPELLKKAVSVFGSQCIVSSIEAKKIFYDRWEIYTDCGRERTGIDLINWIKRVQDYGVGEIILSSVDNDGLKCGFEIDLIKKIRKICRVPLIVHGGAGNPSHLAEALNLGVDGVCAASIFHYNLYSVAEVKKYLKKEGFKIR